MKGLDSIGRRVAAIEAELSRQAAVERKQDAPAVVAEALRAIGAEVRPGPHTGGCVVIESHEDDPPDLHARIDATLQQLDAAGLTEGVTVVNIDLYSAARRGEAAARGSAPRALEANTEEDPCRGR